MGGLAKVFAQVPDRWDLWSNTLKEWNVKKSIAVEEWRAEGREEGRNEGRHELLFDVLRECFGELPEDLVEKVRQTTDAATLRRWVPLAGRAADLAAFRAQADI